MAQRLRSHFQKAPAVCAVTFSCSVSPCRQTQIFLVVLTREGSGHGSPICALAEARFLPKTLPRGIRAGQRCQAGAGVVTAPCCQP